MPTDLVPVKCKFLETDLDAMGKQCQAAVPAACPMWGRTHLGHFNPL